MKKKSVILAFLVLVLLGNFELFAGTPAELIEEALKCRNLKKLSESVRLLQSALKNKLSESQALLVRQILGDCLMELKKPLEAKKVFEEILEASPGIDEEVEARFRIAQCLASLGDAAGLKSACNLIIRRFPESPYAELAKSLSKADYPKNASKERETLNKEEISSREPEIQKDTQVELPPRKEGKKTKFHEDSPADSAESVSDLVSPGKKSSTPKDLKTALDEARKPEGATPKDDILKRPQESQISAKTPLQIPKDLLFLGHLSQPEKEELATKILADQNKLSLHSNDPSAEEVLLRLASRTALFGEPLEACKLYDQFLKKYPSSPSVEEAFFEAIRLRAVLKAFKQVKTWSDSFLKAFPGSSRSKDISRLVDYAESCLSGRKNSSNRRSEFSKSQAMTSKSETGLCDDRRYLDAKRKMSSEKYLLALADFLALSSKYPNDSLIWWELALVQIQLKKFDEAEKSLNKLLEINPNKEEARSLLGYIHYQKKDYRRAAAEYNQAGSTSSEGLDFFDSKNAVRRIEKSQRQSRQNSKQLGENHAH